MRKGEQQLEMGSNIALRFYLNVFPKLGPGSSVKYIEVLLNQKRNANALDPRCSKTFSILCLGIG